jgi:hypothetical protein
VAASSAVLDGVSHAGVVLHARHLPNQKVAGNGHQRRKPDGRRDGQNANGAVDCGAAGRGGKERRDPDSRISWDGARGRARRAAERRSGSLAGTPFRKSTNRRGRRSIQEWPGPRAAWNRGLVLARHGTEWFILDDGFQHLPLARDADVVLIDSTDPFGGGLALPAGRLREPISALERADVVVITRSIQTPAPAIEAMVRRHTKSSIFYASTKLENVLRVPQLAVALPPKDWPRSRFLAFCGIGNPAAFFDDLRRWGFHVVRERSFADHHVYVARDMAELELAAAICGADALLCTEKDVWNLRHVQFTSKPVYCCRISLELPAEQFQGAIAEAVRRKRNGAAR